MVQMDLVGDWVWWLKGLALAVRMGFSVMVMIFGGGRWGWLYELPRIVILFVGVGGVVFIMSTC